MSPLQYYMVHPPHTAPTIFGIISSVLFIIFTQTITTDMLLLAIIKEVRDYEIVLSLPGGSSGFLPITNIPDIYNRHLEKLSNDDKDGGDDSEDQDDEVR